jgi:hypothetical protein
VEAFSLVYALGLNEERLFSASLGIGGVLSNATNQVTVDCTEDQRRMLTDLTADTWLALTSEEIAPAHPPAWLEALSAAVYKYGDRGGWDPNIETAHAFGKGFKACRVSEHAMARCVM